MLKFIFAIMLTATQMPAMPVPTVIDSETAQAVAACISDAVADESGYEVDESEAYDYCTRSN